MHRRAHHAGLPLPLTRLALALGLLLAGCDGGDAGLGGRCDGASDCGDGLQCLENLCAPRCQLHGECGDGRRCDDGTCTVVESRIGAPCASEIGCGAGQSCMLDELNHDRDGRLAASCQPSLAGAVSGERCTADPQCRSGTCALGMCADLCVRPGDCPARATCADLPRRAGADAPLFGVCLPASGVIDQRVTPTGPELEVEIPVPSTARSFAVVATVDEPGVVVGATELSDPGGRPLYRQPSTPEQFYANPIRHLPGLGVATLLVPNSPHIGLTTGLYRARLAVNFGPGQPAPTAPEVHILYKVDDAATLDLHLVFLDLDDHPCQVAWGGGPLDSITAPANPAWQDHLAALRGIFAAAGITLGDVSYRDLRERVDLVALDRERVGDLFALATATSGVTVFVVRSLAPVGIQALAGRPQPPRTPGTPDSGVVIAADTLCYRSWPAFTRTTAHQIGSAMGLFRNREPDGDGGHVDPIDDSDRSPHNLMYFGDDGGVELSAGQAAVLRHYPGLR